MFDLEDDSVRAPEHNGVKIVHPARVLYPVAYPLTQGGTLKRASLARRDVQVLGHTDYFVTALVAQFLAGVTLSLG